MKKVLIVDDSEVVRRKLLKLLSGPEIEVLTAVNGVEGLLHLEARGPDLILLDSRMPKVDGMGVLQAMRQRSLKVPVMVLSAETDPEITASMKEFETVIDFVLKPFDSNELLAKIQKALDMERGTVVDSEPAGKNQFLVFSAEQSAVEKLTEALSQHGDYTFHSELDHAIDFCRASRPRAVFLDMSQNITKLEAAHAVMQEVLPTGEFIALVPASDLILKERLLERGFHRSLSLPLNKTIIEAFCVKFGEGDYDPLAKEAKSTPPKSEAVQKEPDDAPEAEEETPPEPFVDEGPGRRKEMRYRCDGGSVLWRKTGLSSLFQRKWNTGILLDLSESGLSMELRGEVLEGQIISIELHFIDEEAICLKGMVRYSFRSESRKWSKRDRAGISFLAEECDPSHLEHIKEYLASKLGESVFPLKE